MKVLLVNVVCGIKSTGRICTDLAEALESSGHAAESGAACRLGHKVKIAYGRENIPEKYRKYGIRTASDWEKKLSALSARLLDNAGFSRFNRVSTERLIEEIREFDPDVINLHVLHGYWLELETFFGYLRNCGKKIIWTFHDCWAFTGHCPYFDYAGCDRWKYMCRDCPCKGEYPAALLLDRSRENYLRKKDLFTGIPNLTIVTPSNWLKKLVGESFLKEYPVEVINNGIDTSVFRRTPEVMAEAERLKEKYAPGELKAVVAVSTSWDRRKGLPGYFELADELGEEYRVIIVGLPAEKLSALPENVTGVARTDSPLQLAAFYAMAHCYVNASLEENYPTTNLEALACGTPVVTYNAGGSGESAALYGRVVPVGNVPALAEAVRQICRNRNPVLPVCGAECGVAFGENCGAECAPDSGFSGGKDGAGAPFINREVLDKKAMTSAYLRLFTGQTD